jgi:hypothetical protein
LLVGMKFRTISSRQLSDRAPLPAYPVTLNERMLRGVCLGTAEHDEADVCSMFRQDILAMFGLLGIGLNRTPLSNYLDGRMEWPNTSAVYFIYTQQGELLYIGKARSLRYRWIDHHLTKVGGDDCRRWEIDWWDMDEDCIGMVEFALIQKLSPPLNKRSN